MPDIAFDITGRNGERRLPGVVQQLDDIAAIQFHGRQRLRVNGIEENKDDALVGKQFTLCGYVGRDVRVFEASVKVPQYPFSAKRLPVVQDREFSVGDDFRERCHAKP